MDVADKASRDAMEAADGTKEEGTEVMLTTIPDPDPVPNIPTKKIGCVRTTPKDPEKPERVILRDETRSKINEEHQPEVGRGVIRRLRHVKPHDVSQGVTLVPGEADATRSSRNRR